MKILPVILSGGFGTRLWPLSRKHSPKQFLRQNEEGSLFSKSLNLIDGEDFLPPMIVSNEAHKFFILDETSRFSSLILEPASRNTAASIALASLEAKKHYGEEITLLVMPSDHLISDKNLFLKSVQEALKLAVSNITLFGIKPTYPATGYGYIETNDTSVTRFREKPNKETAEEFLSAGNFLWSSGIFMFMAKTILKSFAELAPKTLEIANASISGALRENKIITLQESPFKEAEDISFDYAILEKTTNVSCTQMLSPWTDVGDLISFAETLSKPSKSEMLECKNMTVISEKLVACIGLENMTIVDTRDAILIAKNESLQDVKKIVKFLEEKGAEEALYASKVHRPWGYYEVLYDSPNYKVKKIFVKPGCKLSLQSHEMRSEHWVVTKGTATIVIDEKEFSLNKGEATHIPLKAKHRLANNTTEPVTIIETQIGEYLGEDDIMRYEDVYGRIKVKIK